MGLYDGQECRDIINERSPWEIVKGPSGETAISSRYAIFYRNGSFDDIEATNNFGGRESVKDLYPACHWIFNIPEGNQLIIDLSNLGCFLQKYFQFGDIRDHTVRDYIKVGEV